MRAVLKSLTRFTVAGPLPVQARQRSFVVRHCSPGGAARPQHTLVRHDQDDEQRRGQPQPEGADQAASPDQPRQHARAGEDQQTQIADGAVPLFVSGYRAAAGLQSLCICVAWIAVHDLNRL